MHEVSMPPRLAAAMQAFAPGLPLLVAYSGGADSTALLLACARRWPGQVYAVHVHHGLQSAADAFARHCEQFCTGLGVPLLVRHVNARHAAGQSPEDAARDARYQALQAAALELGTNDVALAQHADDQAETLLLALSRGAGLPGLAAMGAQWRRSDLTFWRPLLEVPGAELRAWLAAGEVPFVEDPTNTDEQFTRNRIRARLLPALDAAFPQFRDTFARSARHAAQAQRVLDEVAAQDLQAVGLPPKLKALQALSPERQANVLRHWLKTAHRATPSAAQLDELLSQVRACTTRGHRIHIKVGSGFVQRKGAHLDWYNP
jgi:tRNA(Ile)-lysidine synthase